MNPHNLSSPSYANYSTSIMRSKCPNRIRHAQMYCELIGSWALLENSVSASLSYLMLMGNDSANILLGTMDFRGRFTKLQKLYKALSAKKTANDKLIEYRNFLDPVRKMRNIISHYPVCGWDKNNVNLFYLKTLHGVQKGRGDAYRLNYNEIKIAADYAHKVGGEIFKFTVDELPIKSILQTRGLLPSQIQAFLDRKTP